MRSILPSQTRSLEPTHEHLLAAEKAAYRAMIGGKTILLAHHTLQSSSEKLEDHSKGVICQKHLALLRKTSIEDFLSNYRVNGLECMTTAYE